MRIAVQIAHFLLWKIKLLETFELISEKVKRAATQAAESVMFDCAPAVANRYAKVRENTAVTLEVWNKLRIGRAGSVSWSSRIGLEGAMFPESDGRVGKNVRSRFAAQKRRHHWSLLAHDVRGECDFRFATQLVD